MVRVLGFRVEREFGQGPNSQAWQMIHFPNTENPHRCRIFFSFRWMFPQGRWQHTRFGRTVSTYSTSTSTTSTTYLDPPGGWKKCRNPLRLKFSRSILKLATQKTPQVKRNAVKGSWMWTFFSHFKSLKDQIGQNITLKQTNVIMPLKFKVWFLFKVH